MYIPEAEVEQPNNPPRVSVRAMILCRAGRRRRNGAFPASTTMMMPFDRGFHENFTDSRDRFKYGVPETRIATVVPLSPLPPSRRCTCTRVLSRCTPRRASGISGTCPFLAIPEDQAPGSPKATATSARWQL